jgi:hypothetical protein
VTREDLEVIQSASAASAGPRGRRQPSGGPKPPQLGVAGARAGVPGAGGQAAGASGGRRVITYEDDDGNTWTEVEGGEEELPEQPDFQISFNEDGGTVRARGGTRGGPGACAGAEGKGGGAEEGGALERKPWGGERRGWQACVPGSPRRTLGARAAAGPWPHPAQEYVEFDEAGNVRRRVGGEAAEASSSGRALPAGRSRRAGSAEEDDEEEDDMLDEEGDDDELDFSGGAAGWGELEAGPGPGSAAPAAGGRRGGAGRGDTRRSTAAAREMEALLGEGGSNAAGQALGDAEEDDWGMEGLPGGSATATTLMEELGVVKTRRGAAAAKEKERERKERRGRGRGGGLDGEGGPLTLAEDPAGAAIQWGGTGLSVAGVDLEAQEALLGRMFKPHRVKALMKHQVGGWRAGG